MKIAWHARTKTIIFENKKKITDFVRKTSRNLTTLAQRFPFQKEVTGSILDQEQSFARVWVRRSPLLLTISARKRYGAKKAQ